MKILWVSSNFMHPTTKGGQIRTLEILRRLHRRHEIHFVAIENPAHPEGPARAEEYSTRAYPFPRKVVDWRSPAFALQLFRSVVDPMPLSVRRFQTPALGIFLKHLIAKEGFDLQVCDFLHPAAHFPGIERAVLFQHNVETMIWQRHAHYAGNPLSRWYLGKQAERMFRFERDVCLRAGHVIAVSEQDASIMRELFGVEHVTAVPTGVDVEFFAPPDPPQAPACDLVFIGSMDWLPNVDGVTWFVREILPLIRSARPGCSVAIVGRTPPPSVVAMGRRDQLLHVTGTVPDIRPHLWGSAVSIVPLRIGGGTRLKIYESMAARIPVVSTAVGAEGLEVRSPENIRLADSPADFAATCLELLSNPSGRRRQALAAWDLVSSRFSWEMVTQYFEDVFEIAAVKQARRAFSAGAGNV